MVRTYSHPLLLACVVAACQVTLSDALMVALPTQASRSICVGRRHRILSTSLQSGVTSSSSSSQDQKERLSSVQEASSILSAWDTTFVKASTQMQAEESRSNPGDTVTRDKVNEAVRFLTNQASELRDRDPTKGRLMLGICASSAAQGVAALKSWVTTLGLPRGLLHGMDEGGVPLEINGGVFIKYNTGGVYTFEEVRRSGRGFDSLWKPGDAMLENYDGEYRGVYFQVELEDEEFRQYLCPLDLFEDLPKEP